ncbi:hypothetical protein OE88DRAFT_180413 [Heliocybe sulcata]|uniref:Uncharacterized protein n=1 Tax=Heliocybe sulcata TaxID=5364 RepID=A0A5C3N188_9AGAM|nr:hypothetical protein OE88DRAFT_180413 [Heliocybe sulcata]
MPAASFYSACLLAQLTNPSSGPANSPYSCFPDCSRPSSYSSLKALLCCGRVEAPLTSKMKGFIVSITDDEVPQAPRPLDLLRLSQPAA